MGSADIAGRGHFILRRLDCIGNCLINILKTLSGPDLPIVLTCTCPGPPTFRGHQQKEKKGGRKNKIGPTKKR